jgi:hypothetical protein
MCRDNFSEIGRNGRLVKRSQRKSDDRTGQAEELSGKIQRYERPDTLASDMPFSVP